MPAGLIASLFAEVSSLFSLPHRFGRATGHGTIFDVRDDPQESVNLVAKMPRDTADLERLLDLKA